PPLVKSPHGFRKPDRRARPPDQPNRHGAHPTVSFAAVKPDRAVLPAVNPTAGQVHDQDTMLPCLPITRGTFVGETSITMPPFRRRASRSCIVSWTRLISSTLRTWHMITSPTFRYRAVSPNSTRQGDSVAWSGAG